jgi:thioester reductase-like protein
VRWRGDGEYVFVGRMDRQVKVRGLLIEPEELETRLLEVPGVREAVVVKRSLGPDREGLVAFLCGARFDVGEVRRHLGRALPAWMVPQRIVPLDELPRTSTGKVDLQRLQSEALPDPLDRGELGVLGEVCRQVLGGTVDADAGFIEQGGDSLSLLKVVASAGARGLVVPPALLSSGQSLRAVARWLLDNPHPDMPGALSADWLRRDVESIIGPAQLARPGGELPARDRPGTILLTGATGGLGAHVLVELLRRTEAEIVCLVRAAGARAGHDRLAQALAQSGLSVRTQERRRLGIVAGDLARPGLGLAAATWDDLASRVDAIYHVAAQVNLVQPYEQLRPDNVLGSFEVLRLWSAHRPKWLHHVSTLSVFVATDQNEGLLREDDDLNATRWVAGGYAQSKWAAEWLVRRRTGGGALHYRPGLVTPDSRGGKGASHDFLTLFLRGLARLGCLPARRRDELWLDVAPVDFVARALVYLSLHAGAELGDTFHLPGARSVSLGELVAALGRAGVSIEEVEAGSWKERLMRLEEAEAAACLALCRALPGKAEWFASYRTMDLFQATGVRFGMERAWAGLAGSGIRWPAADAALLDRYVAGALER